MSDVGDKTSERAQSLVNEVGDELLDLEATYRNARSALVDEDADRRRQTDELLSGGADRNELVRQVVSLKTELTRQGEELVARDEYVKALRAQVTELENRVGRGTELELQLGDVQNEIDRSRREVERFKALTDARVVERDEIASQVRLLEVEKAQLRRELEAANDELELIASERSEMRKRIQRLEAEAVRVRRDHESRQVQLASSAEDRAELQRRLTAAQETNAKSSTRLNEVEGLVERRNNEIAHLKKRNSRLEVDLSTLTEAATQLELRTAERDKLLRRVEVLESELTAQTTEAGASKKALELLAARTTERDSLEQKVLDLETRLGDASNQMRKQRDANAQLDVRTAERDELAQQVAELEEELRSERAEVGEWRSTADLVVVMTDERDALKRQVAVLQEQLDARATIDAATSPRSASDIAASVDAPSLVSRGGKQTRSASTSLSARIAELEARMSEELDDLDSTADPEARDRITTAAVTTAAALRDLPSDPAFRDVDVDDRYLDDRSDRDDYPTSRGRTARQSDDRAGGDRVDGDPAADDRVVDDRHDGYDDDHYDDDFDDVWDDDVDDAWDDEDWDDEDWDDEDDEYYDDDLAARSDDDVDDVIDDDRGSDADDDYDADAVYDDEDFDDELDSDDDGVSGDADYDDAQADDADDADDADEGDGEAVVGDADDDGHDDDDGQELAEPEYREPVVLGADDHAELRAAGSRDIDAGDAASSTLRWNDDMLPAELAPTRFDEIPDDQYGVAGKAALQALGLSGATNDPTTEAGRLVDVADDGLVATPSQATLDLYAEALRDLGAGNSSSLLDKAKRGASAIGKVEPRRRIRLPSNVNPEGPEAVAHLLGADNVVLIVDGHGLLTSGQRKRGVRAEAANAIDALSSLATKHSATVEVVFDGNELDPDGSLGSRRNVRVRFARGGVGVGEVLMRLCDTFPGTQAIVLASSDRRVREAARRARINLLSVDQLTNAIQS